MPIAVRLLLSLGITCAIASADAAWAPARAQGMPSVSVACNNEIVRYCPVTTFGEGEIRSCLSRQRANLSATCAVALGARKDERKPGA
jgi:hypothetical protein